MEKYLIIFLIAVIGYVFWKCLTETKEGFGDAVTVDGVDDNNAINTLAKVAKDLQEGGGLKVKGNLEVNGTTTIANNVWHKTLDGKNRFHYGANTHTYFGTGDAYIWRNKGDGDIMVLNGDGTLDVRNSILYPANLWHKSREGKNRVFYENNGTTYYGSGNGNHIFRLGADGGGAEVIIRNDGKLFVSGRDILAELDDLKNNCIRHGETITIRSGRTGFMLQDRESDRVGVFANGNRNGWEKFAIEKCSIPTPSGNPWQPRVCW